jgi:hypothetical protein
MRETFFLWLASLVAAIDIFKAIITAGWEQWRHDPITSHAGARDPGWKWRGQKACTSGII